MTEGVYLVDFAPSISDPRYVIKLSTVLPERARFHIVDEADSGEIHVVMSLFVDNVLLHDITRVWCSR